MDKFEKSTSQKVNCGLTQATRCVLLFHFPAAYAFNEAHQEANKYRAEYSLPVYLELLGDHPFTATLMDDMGMSYQALGDYDSAIKFLRDALRMRKNSLGDHQETARSFHGLGKVNLVIYNVNDSFISTRQLCHP